MHTEHTLKGRSAKLPPERFLSLCMIVKNEERVLGDCLRSVRGVVDEIVIVDTGSTDATVAVAESYHAKIFHFAWNGSFADARNHALAQCTNSYVLYLDADERLEDRDRDRLRNIVRRPSSDVYELRVVSRKTEGKKIISNSSDQARLFRRDPRYTFRYRIHESILPSVTEANGVVVKENITIHHVGYDITDEAMEHKKMRNLEQSVIDVQEFPNDLCVLKKHAQTLLSLGKNDAAAASISTMLQKIEIGACGDVSRPRRAACQNLYAEALMKNGDLPGAHHWASESLRVLSMQNTAHYFLTIINDRLGRYDEALLHLNAIVLQKNEGEASPAEDEFTPAPQDVCYKRAVIFRALKKPLDERRELVAALRFDPAMTGALHDLAAFLAREKNFTQALSLITKACETDPSNGSILHLRALILYQMKRTEEALHDAALAFQSGEAGDPFLQFWIKAAKELGRGSETLPAYALLAERHPDAGDVLIAYIQALVHAQDIPAALSVTDRSLVSVKDEATSRVLTAIRGKLASALAVPSSM